MRRLAQQHATREAEIDLGTRRPAGGPTANRDQVIVLGEPSYSIKKAEHLYMDARRAG